MSNEITVTGSLACYKSTIMSSAIGRSFNGLQFTMSANFFIDSSILATTGGTAIPLGQVTTPHWAFFYNTDAANFVRIANGSGGARLIKLKAGEQCVVPLDDTATPYAFADTASVQLEYLILGA